MQFSTIFFNLLAVAAVATAGKLSDCDTVCKDSIQVAKDANSCTGDKAQSTCLDCKKCVTAAHVSWLTTYEFHNS